MIKEQHERSCHEGRDRVERSLNREVIVPNLRQLVTTVVGDNCHACAQTAHMPRREPKAIFSDYVCHLVMFDLTSMPWPSPEGYKHILVIVDHYSKWMWAYPLLTKGGEDIVRIMSNLFSVEPCPNRWHSDNGKEFINEAMAKVVSKLGLTHSRGMPYNPQCQGLVERRNDTLKGKLTKACIAGGWKDTGSAH